MKETNSNTANAKPHFKEFGLHPDLLRAVLEAGYEHPTPIQAQALTPVINGSDVMGAAQTGTGKTAAFSLPILHRLMPLANSSASPARHPIRALILTPTRELADQVAHSVELYAKYTPLRSAVVFGGVDIQAQKAQLRQGCEVLIATPGRLLDHLTQGNLNLSQVGILVLDEADRMLDMGFMPDLERIVRALPAQRQSLLFSATFSPEIRKLAGNFLKDQPISIEVAARNATADTVTQLVHKLHENQKRQALAHIVRSKGLRQVIAFTNTKAGAARLARQLEQDGLRVESIHGNRTQLERMKVLDAFKAEELDILVATDVAARGIDVAGVPCVVNVDLPFNAEDYVHRIGRTGRAGAKGEAISFCTDSDQHLLDAVEKLIKKKLPQQPLDLPAAAPSRTQHSASGRSDYRRHTEYRQPRHKHDELFYKPYEPQAHSTTAAAQPRPKANQAKKRFVGVLLGGGYY